ncbi:MAG: hypothetical protein KAS02_01950 [Candidatus Pacebacteria bacterium]|nr:hypothetical protein [Candidatus Paceibacterota bacterium]
MDKATRRNHQGMISKNEESFLNVISGIGAIIIVMILLGWSFRDYMNLPTVYFSTRTGEVMAVTAADGTKLPLYPLPQKYDDDYVK